jgi:hypothetical protein
MDAPQRERDLVTTEGAVPRERVVVVGVDERAVDVEDRDCHSCRSGRVAAEYPHLGLALNP